MKKNAFDGLSSGLVRRMQRFAQAEHGAMAPIVLVFFFLMLVLGGIAVDVMRFETRRVAVQNTLDRATLAVANMTSALTTDTTHTTRKAKAQFIVEDYFTKAGLEDNLQYVSLDDGMNYRVVEARANVVSHNIFMNLLGLPILQTVNGSIAEQRITDIEIMLVLDISGSMATNNKIGNLRIAARDFIDQVKATDTENRISIGVIPYNAQVNLGQALRSRYNITFAHGHALSNCVELPIGSNTSNIFRTLALSRALEMPQMTVADTESSSANNNVFYTMDSNHGKLIDSAASRWCNPASRTEITLPTKSADEAKAGINAMQAEGNTSILVGMRWATALIDPSARGIYNELIGMNAMHSDMSGRPYEYNDPNDNIDDALKVIVLMTDGEHVAHKRIYDAYKTGPATITFTYRNASNNNTTVSASVYRSPANVYSVFYGHMVNTSTSTTICNSKPFWIPSTSSWEKRPAGAAAPVGPDCFQPTRIYTPLETSAMRWQDIWSSVRMNYAVRQFFGRAMGGDNADVRTNIYNAIRTQIYGEYANSATMDDRLKSNCAAARSAGVLVYGIAFQAPPAGKKAIESCTSTPTTTYYFDVAETAKIQDAFRMIATNLSQLRLTQ